MQKGGIRFYSKLPELLHRKGCIQLVENVALIFRIQNNGAKHATVIQCWTGKHLCLAKVWSDIITRLESYPGSSEDTPVNTVWVEYKKTTIISQIITNH